MSRSLGIFGSIGINRGDPKNGWDTDRFPNSFEELTLAMIEIIRAIPSEQSGGLTTGGFNFDAKVRCQSSDAADLFHAHIAGIDTIARTLLRAAAIIEEDQLDAFRKERDAGRETGKAIHAPEALASVAELAIGSNQGAERSGRQAWLENLVNRF